MTYKTLRRKSDGQWFGLSWDYPVGLYNASAPQFFDTTIAELSFQWQEFNPDFYIDWSLYELIEVAVIPVDEFPDELDIDNKIQDIGKRLGIEGITGARLMIEWYKSQILKP